MDRVVVAGGLRVALDLVDADRPRKRRQVLTHLDLVELDRSAGHHCGLRMTKRALASETSRPSASVAESWKSTNSIEPRELISAIRPVVRRRSPGRTGRWKV